MTGLDSLSLIPIFGIAIYAGLISGYIPSFLYDRNERWPRQYVILQIFLLVATAARLTHSPYIYVYMHDEDEGEGEDEDGDAFEYNQDIHELADFSLGSAAEMRRECIYLGLGILLAKFVNRHKTLRKWDDTNLPLSILILRNLAIFMTFNLWGMYTRAFSTRTDSSLSQLCEEKYNITPGLVAPDTLADIVTDFLDAWKEFHPSNLRLVRMSHSILYPSIFLLLTRRRYTTFLVWFLFFEFDFHHILADMFHYVSAPELADDRLDFQESSQSCYLNVKFVRLMLSYPLNFVYLTTSMGGTSFPPQGMQSEHEL